MNSGHLNFFKKKMKNIINLGDYLSVESILIFFSYSRSYIRVS